MENEKFVIDSLDKANWALMKMQENNNEIDNRKAQYEEMIKRADKWLEDECREYQEHNTYLKNMLKDFATEELDRRNKGKKKQTKSIKLPYGKIGFKKVYAEFSCGGFKCAANNQSLANTLNKIGLPEFVKQTTVEKVAWNELKSNLVIGDNNAVIYLPTGEIIENIVITKPEGIEFDVKVE